MPTPLVVGLGAACELSGREMEYDHSHVSRLSEILIQVGQTSNVLLMPASQGLTSQLQNVVRNGGDNVFPGCVNLSFHCVEVRVALHYPHISLLQLLNGSSCFYLRNQLTISPL